MGGPKGANQELFIVQFHFVQVLSNSFLSKVGGGGEGAGSQLAPSFKQFHLSLNIPRENNLFSVHLSVALLGPEAQKPKTFRVAAFYAQKLSGRSAQNRFSRQA